MSDNDGKKTLGLRGGGPRSGNVKQSFSHGRTKNVVVETKRKRVVVPKPGASKSTSDGSASAAGKRPIRMPFRSTGRRSNGDCWPINPLSSSSTAGWTRNIIWYTCRSAAGRFSTLRTVFAATAAPATM